MLRAMVQIMMLNPVVLFFDPASASHVDATLHVNSVAGLVAEGFTTYSCQKARQLYELAQLSVRHAGCGGASGLESHADGPEATANLGLPDTYSGGAKNPILAGAPVLAVLNGSLSDNCSIALHIRTLHPQIRIMVLVESFDEPLLIRILQSGADAYCSYKASTRLLSASLFALLRRQNAPQPEGYGVAAVRPADLDNRKWALHDQAWVLVSPAGENVPLTTVERAFMLALLHTPDLRASHAQLLTAINGSYDSDSRVVRQARLGVIVSRMRRKFQKYGLNLPLKSVHNWGYMFSGNA